MNKLTLWALLGATFALGACTDPGTDPKDDTDTDGADTVEDSDTTPDDTDDTDPGVAPFFKAWTTGWEEALDNQCADPEGNFTLTLETVNWGYTAAWYVADTRFTKNYDEEHTFEEENGAGADTYTIFSRTLGTGVFPNTPDQTTTFNCNSGEKNLDPSDADNFQATFAAIVYDAGGAVADCIVFGHDPDALLGGSPPEDLVLPAWLNATDCRDAN